MSMNPYEVLGVSSLDTIDDIKVQYRKLCKKYHPDVPNTGSSEKFIQVKKAWDMICNMQSSENGRMYWSHKTLFTVERRSYVK